MEQLFRLNAEQQDSMSIPRLPLPPKLMIFDFDGVILDSANIKVCAYTTIYADEDPRKLEALVEHCRLHGGITRRTKFAYYEREFFGRTADATAVEGLCRRYSDVVLQAVLDCEFVEGVEQLLRRANGKVQMHVVSGTPEDELQHIVQRRGLASYFDSVRGAPADKRDIFTRIINEAGCAKSQALAIGDSKTELLAAQEVGIPFLGIVGTAGDNPFPPDVPVWATLREAEKRLKIE